MGIFDIFKGYSETEQALLSTHQEMLQGSGLPSEQAREMAKAMLDQAIAEAKQTGLYNLPDNFGDILLGEATSDDPFVAKVMKIVKRRLPASRKDGATDADIKWWWNLTEVERGMMMSQDNITAMAMMRQEAEKHPELSEDEAADIGAAFVRRYKAMHGPDPTDETHTSGDDRDLPLELKDRVNVYVIARASEGPEGMKKDVEKHSSMNAFLRSEIRKGNI